MIKLTDIKKSYVSGPVVTEVLKGISLSIQEGEFVGMMGRSGAGKSTLLYQMSLLDHPTSGALEIDGVDALNLSSDDRTTFRLEKLGYVFQDYALVPELTSEENIMIPLIMKGISTDDAKKRADEVLAQIKLSDKLKSLPSQLSGGEQQRISIARAIAGNPRILFADEPTANLDSASAEIVLSIFNDLYKNGQTIIMITHEEEYTHYCSRIIKLSDGLVLSDEQKK